MKQTTPVTPRQIRRSERRTEETAMWSAREEQTDGMHIPMPRIADSTPAQQKLTETVMNALRSIRSVSSPGEMTPRDLERQRRSQRILGRLAAPMLGLSWEPFDLDGMPAAWVRPERAASPRHAVLYCHGGGYTSGNLNYSRPLAAKLALRTGWPVLCFEYRLAPEHPYPAAPEDALRAWDYLMKLGDGARDVALLGDSAGGNLALVLTQTLRKAGRMPPRRLVLASPWTDMTCSGESYERCAGIDPMLSPEYMHAVRDAYAAGLDWSDPQLSPLFGDFDGFPETLIQAGSNEILFADSARLHETLVAQGVPCRMECWEGMWHVFQMFPLPQADKAMDRAAAFLLDGM